MPRSMHLGFIETPYRKVENGTVNLSSEGIIWLSAEEEEAKVIAQANAPIKDSGEFENPKVKARYNGDYPAFRRP